ncbi:hypothetical protein PTTG_26504 [Puccinia triticina 1-1 BBBD Race 1]|uniref:Uncharacterized protein n=1 Tax=Puccinia triticina (isolate 1-1 / race 1 (BBBD)) TaxID=630390 RepID=A0A180GSY3_PUCT1|nr:hypothetical protein PTTG_26504 [Puccinia triticina 1-1 BBBD Race 1]
MEYSGFVEEYPCSASDIDRYASISDEDGKFWGSALPEHLRLPVPVIAPGPANPDVPIAPMTLGENDPLHSEVTPPQDAQFLAPNQGNVAPSLHASPSSAPASPAEPMGPMAPQSSSDEGYLSLLQNLKGHILPPSHCNGASCLDASYLESDSSAPAILTGSIGPISEQQLPLEEHSNFSRTINPPSFTPSLVDESSPSSLQSYASPSTNPAGSNVPIPYMALTPGEFEQFQASNAFPTAIPRTTNFAEGCPPFLASDPWILTNPAGSSPSVAVGPQRHASRPSPYALSQYENATAFSPQMAMGTHAHFDARQFAPSLANGGQATTLRSSHAPQLPRHANGIRAAAAGIVAPGPSSLASQAEFVGASKKTAEVSQSVKTVRAKGKRAAEPTEGDQSDEPQNKKPRCMLGEDSAVDKHVLEWPHGKLQCLACLNKGVTKVYERKDLYNLRRHLRGPHKIDPGPSYECTFPKCEKEYKHLSDLVKHQAKCKNRP